VASVLTNWHVGAFGEVRMCVHRDTGAQRAVKVLRKSHMDEDEKKMLFNEINILRNLVSLPLTPPASISSVPKRERAALNGVSRPLSLSLTLPIPFKYYILRRDVVSLS
jgi:serine/threonine protein kinase